MTKLRVHLSSSREENTKYTAVWDLLQPWKTASKDRYFQEGAKKLVPEGVEGRVAYKGSVKIHCIPVSRRYPFRYQDMFTRLPVYEDSTDNVIGIINMKDFLLQNDTPEFSVRNLLREPYFTYEHKKYCRSVSGNA